MKTLAFLFLVACSSGSTKPHQESANDPWAVTAKTTEQPGPAAKNLNKLVIGGDNAKPQMGLFALSHDDARRVDAEMGQGLEPAYHLAEKLAVAAWTGNRNFCEDAVRQTLGYFGTKGMLDASELDAWRSAELADVRNKHARAINDLHYQMIGEHDEAGCDKTLGIYVEGLKLAANQKLELRNFGY